MKTLLTALVLIGSLVSGVSFAAEGDAMLSSQVSSGNWVQYRTAARTIYHQGSASQAVLDTMVDALLKGQGATDKYWVDAYSWACKAVAATGNRRYYDAIRQVADNEEVNSKLRKYCGRAADSLGSAEGAQFSLAK